MVFDVEIKEGLMRMNCIGSIFGFTLEDSDVIMARVIDSLISNKKVTDIILAETREYEYDFSQTELLKEIAATITKIVKEKKLVSIKNIGLKTCDKYIPQWYSWIQDLVSLQMRGDPIGAYLTLTREIRHLKTKMNLSEEFGQCAGFFLENCLLPIQEILEGCKLIQIAKPNFVAYHVGDRSIYRKIFKPSIRPNFMYTKYMAQRPDGEIIDKYKIGDTDVEIYKIPGEVRHIYHIIPPEFRLKENEYVLLDGARRILEERRPKELEINDQEKMRELFYTLSVDLLRDLAEQMNIVIDEEQIKKLASILTRYTAGLGIIELLLADSKIQDVYINAPLGNIPIYVGHQDYEECQTNLVPTQSDADRWATRFKLLSGRPLDEANPVLDTEVMVPGGVARIAAINPKLSPDGLGFALRRHRYKPWTFPLFIKEGYFDPLFGGLMWFMASYGRTFLIAGTRSSGKTSFLASMMLQILPYYRIITVEDSVTGDSRLVIKRNGKFEKTEIGKLIDSHIEKYGCINKFGREIVNNFEDIKIFSVDREGKTKLSDVSAMIRHKVKKDIYEVETTTGRKIKVTGDHSLFTVGDDNVLKEIKTNELNTDSFIAVPRNLKFDAGKKDEIDLLEHMDSLDKYYVSGYGIKNLIESRWSEIKSISSELDYSKSMICAWKRSAMLPVKIFKRLNAKDISLEFKPKSGGNSIKSKIELDEYMLTLIGLWLADGCYDKKSIIISVVSEEERDVVRNIAKRFGLQVKMHSDKVSLIINSVILKDVFVNALGLKGDAYTKEIPSWIFDLSCRQKSYVLKGLFSGDGCAGKKEIAIPLSSEKLLYDIQTLLLSYDVILRKSNERKTDGTFNASISTVKSFKNFKENIGFLQKYKNDKLALLCSKISTHDSTDIIPLSAGVKNELNLVCNDFNKHDYITRENNIGREHLNKLINGIDLHKIPNPVRFLPFTDILWDRIKNIKKINCAEEYVYDISVPENENFVCENILAHNTLELPVEALRKIGYNIQRMKSRSVITKIETELPADEALRTALRLGDSCMFIGEVRSVEAKALYEAMRIGALANTVAGTIHGESAYGVFDRVVNDLGVPPTSFKATDIVVVCNRLKSQDGIHTRRRIVEVTEVRKHWKTDPQDEGGFVNLMSYSSETDGLKPTDTLLNGESYILNELANRVPGWAGRWNLVWDNIQLRAKILESIVRISKEKNMPELLEAETVVKSNQMFSVLCDKSNTETGSIDNKRVYDEWLEWFNKQVV
ncbi:MAG: Flp pilus assembly complex ATPase component TadA [Nanoarchaeota archaeon]|nr:Flp pilus assembly complex ATPase component TadA [Nanoarchaeota archaeon]